MNPKPKSSPCLVTFPVLALLSAIPLYFYVDLPVAIFFEEWLQEPLESVIDIITDSGEWVLAVFVLALIFFKFIRKDKLAAWRMSFPVIAYVGSGIFVNILKPMFGRFRPKAYFREDIYGFEPFGGIEYVRASFPSGHSISMMAMMTAAAIIFPKWRVPLFCAGIFIGLTRIVLQAHWVGDVVVGLTLGYCFTHFIFKWMKPKLFPEAR